MHRTILSLVGACFLTGCPGGPGANLDSGDPYERYLGALDAARSNDPESLKRVEAQLKDPDPLARTGAVVALSRARPDGSLKLLTGMLSDPDAGVRAEAVRAVWRFREAASVADLANVLATDRDVEPRRVAALALGEFPDGPAVRSALLEAFSDSAAGVAYNAHQSLVRLTGRADLPRDRAAAERVLKRS
jgi:HEAT repeat protein